MTSLSYSVILPMERLKRVRARSKDEKALFDILKAIAIKYEFQGEASPSEGALKTKK